MSIHTNTLANGKLIQQKPEYRCSSCGDYFPGDQLEEVPYRDPQNGMVRFSFLPQVGMSGPKEAPAMNREGQSDPPGGLKLRAQAFGRASLC
jgi:hypothetical protein